MALTQVNSLEFNEIKSQLKAYLKGQAEFSDYDFEGSSLSTLLAVSYTHLTLPTILRV